MQRKNAGNLLRGMLTLACLGALADCTSVPSHITPHAIPSAQPTQQLGIDKAFTGSTYDFGIGPLTVAGTGVITLDGASVTGAPAQLGHVTIRALRVQDSVPVGVLVGPLERTLGFHLTPVRGTTIDAASTKQGDSGLMLVVSVVPTSIGQWQTKGICVDFHVADNSTQQACFGTTIRVVATHDQGTDPRVKYTRTLFQPREARPTKN